MYCKNCGKEIKDKSSFCKFCGQTINKKEEKDNTTSKDKIILEEKSSIIKVISMIISIIVIIYTFCLGIDSPEMFYLTSIVGILALLFVWWIKYTFVKYVGVCKNCGKEIKLNDEKLICKDCNIKYDYIKNENIKIKKFQKYGNIAIILVSILCLILPSLISNGIKEINVPNSSNETKNNISYIRNKIGIIKSNDIQEYYNDSNDLTDLNSKKIDNVKFKYLYDIHGRVSKISTNKNDSYIMISYLGNTKTLKEVKIYISKLGEYSYNYIYADESKYPFITEYFKSEYNGTNELIGQISFEEQESNSKKYILAIETDGGNIKNKVLYEKANRQKENIFSILGLLPDTSYINTFNTCYGNNFTILNGQIASNFNPIYTVNFGRIIKSYNKNNGTTEYLYDINGNLLCQKGKDSNFYYKYEYLSDDVCIVKSLIADLYEKEYYIQKGKIYFSNKEIEKVEMTNEEKITIDEYNKDISEYKKYCEENKVDLSTLKF